MSARPAAPGALLTPGARPAPALSPRLEPGALPPALVAALGERLAAEAAAVQAHVPADIRVEAATLRAALARFERLGVQLQSLAQVIARATALRREPVDLGLALLQTVGEWSAEAARLGVELQAPACHAEVDANPAAVKHLLDLLVEHGLQQGRALRLDVDTHSQPRLAFVVLQVDSAPATSAPVRDTAAWLLLQALGLALGLVPQRTRVPGGERLVVALPRV